MLACRYFADTQAVQRQQQGEWKRGRRVLAQRERKVHAAVLDTLDFVVGWCSPHMRLFP